MQSFLRELGLEATSDLGNVLAVAWQLHQQLNPQSAASAPVTRAVLLHAATFVNMSIAPVLTRAGLNVDTWRNSVKLPLTIEDPESPAPDFNISDGVRNAVVNWLKDHPRDRFDATALAAAIIASADRSFLERLELAGLNVSDAAHKLHSLHDVHERTGSPQHAQHASDAINVPGIRLSDSVYFVLTQAKELAEEAGDHVPITTSLVLIACVERAGQVPEFVALRKQLEERAGSELEPKIKEWMAWYGSAVDLQKSVTSAVFRTLDRARMLAVQSTGHEEIGARHLLAALLSPGAPTGAVDFLRSLGIGERSLQRFLFALVDLGIKTNSYPDRLARWLHWLGGMPDEQEEPPQQTPKRRRTPRFRVAEVATDSVEGPDLLQFQREVDSFATLIASKNLKPPLSIGIFGDWGSGKSFFMRQLRQSIDQLTAEVVAAEKQGRILELHNRIVQIEFNAWHYVESNLWASLVEHIFRNLKLAGETEDESDRRQKELLQQLDAAMAKQIEAAARVARARSEQELAAAQVAMETKATETMAAALQRLNQEDTWDLVRIEDKEKTLIAKALEDLGVAHAVESTGQIREVISEIRGLSNRGRLLWTWMVQGAGAPLRLSLFALVLLVPLAATIFLPLLSGSIEALRPFGIPLVQLATLAGGAATWLAANVRKGRDFLAKLDTARAAIDRKLEAAEQNRRREIDRIRQKQVEAEDHLARAVEALRHADHEVREAQHNLELNTPDRQLAQFIEQRVASDDYRKLLGVLAMIRGDFDKLSKLMDHETLQRAASETFHIDRIVLYIDDLDRCPPARVVEVLQAVHLLLAYKLFVVVVGVDARWVSRSLERQYRHLLETPRSLSPRTGAVAGFHVTPQDYLEKIFQVPFWIRPMTPDATQALIDGVVGVESELASTADIRMPPPSATDRQQSTATAPSPGLPDLIPPPAAPPAPSVSVAEEGDDRLNPVRLRLQPRERDAMKALAPLVGRSPRTVKRFVNIYRIIRASQSPGQLETFIDDNADSPYQQVLLLLGVIAGAPLVSVEILERIRGADSEKLLGDIATDLTAMPGGLNLAKTAEWTRATAAIREFSERANPRLASLQENLPTVSRFSFRPAR